MSVLAQMLCFQTCNIYTYRNRQRFIYQSSKLFVLGDIARNLFNCADVKRRDAVEACRAHNPKVDGSKPSGATLFEFLRASFIFWYGSKNGIN